MIYPTRSSVYLSVLALLLAACGGGGGGGSQAPANQLPTANAGPAQTVLEGASVTLTGSGTDPDGSISAFAWSQTAGPGVTLAGANSASATFIAPLNDASVDVTFSLQVTDNSGATATSTTTVTIEPSVPPSVVAQDDVTVLETRDVQINGTASDVDGRIVTLAWSQTAGTPVTLTGADTDTASFAAPSVTAVEILEFELRASDDTMDEGFDTLTVTVQPNLAPVVAVLNDFSVVETVDVEISGTATDADGQIDSLAWTQLSGTPVVLTDDDTDTARFTAPAVTSAETLEFELRATDDIQDAGADTVIVTVEPNEPPQLATLFPCNQCRAISDLTVTGTVDFGADSAFVAALDSVVSVVASTPGGAVPATVSADGSWIAQNVPLPTNGVDFDLTVTATDSFGETTDTITALSRQPSLTAGTWALDPGDPDAAYVLETNSVRERLVRFDLSSSEFEILFQADTLIPGTGTNIGATIALALDAANDRLLTADSSFGEILAVSRATGALSVLSGGGVGAGVAFGQPSDIRLDADDNRLIVWDTSGLGTLIGVDLTTGDRTILSDNSGVGTGPSIGLGNGFGLDAANDIVYGLSGGGILLTIDLATGDRTSQTGSGPGIVRINSPTFNAVDNLVGVMGSDAVYTSDPADATRTLISPAGSSGISVGLDFPELIAIPNTSDYLAVDSALSGNLVRVNSADGSRARIFRNDLGSFNREYTVQDAAARFDANGAGLIYMSYLFGVVEFDTETGTARDIYVDPGTGFSRKIAVDEASGDVFTVDSASQIWRQDPVTLARSVVSSAIVGSGPTLGAVSAMTVDGLAGRLYVVDEDNDAVLQVDLATGDRAVVSGAGTPFQEVNDIVLDRDNNRLIATENGDGSTPSIALLAIDLTTGDRSVLSSVAVGSGSNFVGLYHVDLINSDTAMAADRTEVYLIDLMTGNRTVIADSLDNRGEVFGNLFGAGYDPVREVAYLWEQNSQALLVLHVGTGNRVVIAK